MVNSGLNTWVENLHQVAEVVKEEMTLAEDMEVVVVVEGVKVVTKVVDVDLDLDLDLDVAQDLDRAKDTGQWTGRVIACLNMSHI